MEFEALRIFIGDASIVAPIEVKLTKSSLSLRFNDEEAEENFVVILKKDIKKIEHSKLKTTIPFLCLYLSVVFKSSEEVRVRRT